MASAPNLCPNCGAEVLATDHTCMSCGHDVGARVAGEYRRGVQTGLDVLARAKDRPPEVVQTASVASSGSLRRSEDSSKWLEPVWSSRIGRWEKTGWAVGFACAIFFGFGAGYFTHWTVGVLVGATFALLGRWVGRLHDNAGKQPR